MKDKNHAIYHVIRNIEIEKREVILKDGLYLPSHNTMVVEAIAYDSACGFNWGPDPEYRTKIPCALVDCEDCRKEWEFIEANIENVLVDCMVNAFQRDFGDYYQEPRTIVMNLRDYKKGR